VSIVSVDTSLEEIRDNPMGAAFKADSFGAKYATIYWAPHNGEIGFTIEDAKRLVDVLNTGGAILKEHGVTLQYHPHGYEFLAHEDGTLLDYIIQNTNEAQFQMDVFWIKQGGADPLAILQKYAGRFTSLHLKDRLPGSKNSSNGSADVETNVVLGKGDVGIAALIKEAKAQGIKYFFIEDESSRVLKQVPMSYAYIKPLIDE
jgi:sugar phosphate isomerase/epimerase